MTRENRSLVITIIAGMLALAAIGLIGATKADSAKRAAVNSQRAAVSSQRALDVQRQNASRTECFRNIGAALDHYRWKLIGEAVTTADHERVREIGETLRTMPTNVFYGEHGGVIEDQQFDPCPPAPVPTKETP